MKRTILLASAVGWAAFLAVGCSNSTTSNTDAGAQDLSAATHDLAMATVSCANYCQIVTANCTGPTGSNSMYPNTQSCLNACANFALGTAGDTSGDTVACRTYHATAAASDPATHCPHAGPSGGGMCGTDRCQAFCELESVVCTPENGLPSSFPFTSKADCLTKCGTAPFAFSSSMPEQQQAGATLNCAFYHLTEAFVSPSPDAGATASDHCEDFDPSNPNRGCQ